MTKTLYRILLAFSILGNAQVFACDESVSCDKCGKDTEFSWNPNSQFVTDRLSRFYGLGDQIQSAYKANDFAKVKELAKENLELAAVYRCNWNYGNAIHDTNRILGLVSLKNGDIDSAVDYLRKAGKTTGSPQLNTFGPELDLANELLQRGKVEAVASYLKDIKSFWEMNNGQVDTWLAEIGKGGKPELDRFAANRPGPFLMFLAGLTMAWPLILSTVFLYVKRTRITKKVLYFIVAALSGYALMFLVNWASDYAIQATISSMENLSQTAVLLISYSPLGLALLFPFFANVYLARLFYSNAADTNR